jgi:hypothetical protein
VNILQPPYIYQDEFNDIYADVDYFTLKQNEDYNLAFIDLYSSLDYTPVRKIKFNNNTKQIRLKDYYPGILPNQMYLFWIENKDYIKLSKPSLFIHNDMIEYNQYLNIYNSETLSTINKIRNKFLAIYNNKQIVKDLFDNLYD